MKNIAATFVVVLALAGSIAATRTTSSTHLRSSFVLAKTTAFPIPTCPLDDPNGCGIAGPPSAQK